MNSFRTDKAMVCTYSKYDVKIFCPATVPLVTVSRAGLKLGEVGISRPRHRHE